MVRDPGKSHRPEIDRVVPCQSVESILRHHAAGVVVGLTTPVVVRPVEFEVKIASDGVQHPNTLGHDFLADPVAGQYGDAVTFHLSISCGWHVGPVFGRASIDRETAQAKCGRLHQTPAHERENRALGSAMRVFA